MKFTIDSATFKNITERASAVSNKTGFTVYETSVNLIADAESQKVIVKSTNLNAFAEVFTDNVSVQESGNVFVDVDDLKRLYNIIGDLTVESDGKTLLVRGSKKQGEVCATEQNNMDFPQVDGEMAFAADKEDMLDTFSKLSCCLESDMNGAKKLFAGFNVADVLCRPRIAALDGYRAAVRVTEWKYRIGLNITVPGYIVKELTKVSANKKTEEITVYASDKHARFVGSDFAYTTRLLKGKYLDIDSLLVLKEQTYAFEIAADKLFAVAKEYEIQMDTAAAYSERARNIWNKAYVNPEGVDVTKELAKAYNPKDFEDRIYAAWNEKGCFRAEVDPKKTPYTIVIPLCQSHQIIC